jgi:hypothetical protein
MMLGLNRTTREQGRTSFEFFRIEQTRTALFISPARRGGPPPSSASRNWRQTAGCSKIRTRFSPAHRVLAEGDRVLHARIEGLIKGTERKEEWHWQKLR